jgi:hypothetical protein
MVRRPFNFEDAQAKSSLSYWDRPLHAKIAGLTVLVGTALMLLGGAFREQAGLIRSGLLLLAMGAVFLPAAFRKTPSMKVAFYTLAVIGVFCAVTT